MQEFIFGTLASPDQRVARLVHRLDGVRHLGRLTPMTPGAGDRPVITVTVGLPSALTSVICQLLEPVPQTIALARTGTEWDLPGWRYVSTWQAALPAFPAGTVVRYTLAAIPYAGDDPLPADDGAVYSYLVDAGTPPAWSREAIIYQIFPDRFSPGVDRDWQPAATLGDIYGGTLRGIIEKLDYVADLGFNCLWLNPFFPDHTHHGYHATDYFAVNPRLGSLADIRELVDAAHARGMRVLLDFVANHWGSGHATFQEALRDPNSAYVSWYLWSEWPNYEMYFGVRDLPKVNVDDPGARDYLLRAADFWLREMDFDGYRLDHAQGPSHDFWLAFRQAVRAARPDAWIFGEVIDSPTFVRTYAGRLDGCLDFHLLQALRDTFAFRTMSLTQFDGFLDQHERFFPASFSRPSFLDNHDMNRFLWLVGGDTRRLKLAALCQFTLSGPPIVYYGTEVGLSQDRDLLQPDGRVIMEESRLPMIWGDGQDDDLLAFYRGLIAFRRAHPVLWRGSRQTLLLDEAAGLYAYARLDETERVVVVLNNSPEPREARVEDQVVRLGPWEGSIVSR